MDGGSGRSQMRDRPDLEFVSERVYDELDEGCACFALEIPECLSPCKDICRVTTEELGDLRLVKVCHAHQEFDVRSYCFRPAFLRGVARCSEDLWRILRGIQGVSAKHLHTC